MSLMDTGSGAPTLIELRAMANDITLGSRKKLLEQELGQTLAQREIISKSRHEAYDRYEKLQKEEQAKVTEIYGLQNRLNDVILVLGERGLL